MSNNFFIKQNIFKLIKFCCYIYYLSIYYTWKNIKSECNNNKFKISTPTSNETFDLPDDSYSIDDIQDYFAFIIKKHETLTDNSPVQIYANKIKNRIVF